VLAKRAEAQNPTIQSDPPIDDSAKRIYLGWCLSEVELKKALDLLGATKIEVRKSEIVHAYGQVAGGFIEMASAIDAAKAFDVMIGAGLKVSLPRQSRPEPIAIPDEAVAAPPLAYLPKVS